MIKIISFNIENASKNLIPLTKNYWGTRNNDIEKVMENEMPDVICLQEATNIQLTDLDKCLEKKLQYTRFGEYTYYPVLMSDCNAIYYKKAKFDVLDSGSFTLSETPSKRYVKMKGSDYYRNCNWMKLSEKADPDNVFYIFDTHTNGSDGGEEHQKILVEEIEKIVRPEDKVIVCGDFNFFLDSGRLKTMTDRFDNARTLAGYIEEDATYHDRTPGKIRCAIDYFFTGNIGSVKYGPVKYTLSKNAYLSDHYPIEIMF